MAPMPCCAVLSPPLPVRFLWLAWPRLLHRAVTAQLEKGPGKGVPGGLHNPQEARALAGSKPRAASELGRG